MAYVIGSPCEGVCDASCVDACPVDCIYAPLPIEQIKQIRQQAQSDDEKMEALQGYQLYINPDECIDCDACLPQCPVDAIRPEDESSQLFDVEQYREVNEQFFEQGQPAYNSAGLRDE
jgi:NAD-dependent dihydropyrimidine dehydrogenase PreA subunit